MKKFLTIGFVLASMVFAVPVAEAKDSSANSFNTETVQQRRGQRRDNRNRRNNDYRRSNRRVRTYYQTRYVWRGRHRYRETYRITVFRNGRRQVSLVRRVRVNDRRDRRNY